MTDVAANTQRLLDQAADRAWNRMVDAQGTPLYDMCRDVALAAKDRADRFAAGVRAGTETLDQLPGPMLRRVVAALLRVTSDAEDDQAYDAGFRTALRLAARGACRVVR